MEAVQRQRLELRFALYDRDGDGRVSVDDFSAEARGILQALGESEDSPKGSALVQTYSDMFPDAAALSDVLGSAGGALGSAGGALGSAGGALGDLAGGAPEAPAVTSDQFITLVDTVLISAGNAGYDAVLAPTIRSIAQVCDTDDDGQVDGDAFKSWLGVIGVDASTAAEAFAGIDTDGDGKVSVDEIVDAVRDYHLGRLDAPLLGR